MKETRKVGDYEITNSIYIGDKKIVMGENMNAKDGNFYLVAYCETNELLQQYKDCIIGNDFIEIAEIFAGRLQEQIRQVKEEHDKIAVSKEPIELDQCIPMRDCGDIDDKIVVVRPSVLRPEYRTATNQLYIVKSGNGIRNNSRGTAVFCDNLYSGEHTRFERYDFMGVLKPEQYPDWVKDKIKEFSANQKLKKDKGVER